MIARLVALEPTRWDVQGAGNGMTGASGVGWCVKSRTLRLAYYPIFQRRDLLHPPWLPACASSQRTGRLSTGQSLDRSGFPLISGAFGFDGSTKSHPAPSEFNGLSVGICEGLTLIGAVARGGKQIP